MEKPNLKEKLEKIEEKLHLRIIEMQGNIKQNAGDIQNQFLQFKAN